MKRSLYTYTDYRTYLLAVIAEKDGDSRGFRSRLAEELGCQRTFISQVLGGQADFNLEHADTFSRWMGLTDEEAEFFLTLVSLARAGTTSFKNRLQKKLKTLRVQNSVLQNRFREKKALNQKDEIEYYSTWLYGAIRVLLTIPQYQSRAAVLKYFSLPADRVHSAIEFLLSRKLIQEQGARLSTTVQHMYLNHGSKLLVQHHKNWRLQAIDALEFDRETDLHFSSVNSLSREDVTLIRERLAEVLTEVRDRIKASPEECVYTLCMDFFEV